MKNPFERISKMNTAKSLFAMMFGVAIVFACGAPENTRGSQAKRGYDHFLEHCSSCHGENGKGLKVDSLAIQPADLTRITARRRLNEFPIMTVAKIIDGRADLKSHGDRPMPIWGDVFSKQKFMTEDEIRGELGEIIAYLMKIQRS